jgi:hypothetical protein
MQVPPPPRLLSAVELADTLEAFKSGWAKADAVYGLLCSFQHHGIQPYAGPWPNAMAPPQCTWL